MHTLERIALDTLDAPPAALARALEPALAATEAGALYAALLALGRVKLFLDAEGDSARAAALAALIVRHRGRCPKVRARLGEGARARAARWSTFAGRVEAPWPAVLARASSSPSAGARAPVPHRVEGQRIILRRASKGAAPGGQHG